MRPDFCWSGSLWEVICKRAWNPIAPACMKINLVLMPRMKPRAWSLESRIMLSQHACLIRDAGAAGALRSGESSSGRMSSRLGGGSAGKP